MPTFGPVLEVARLMRGFPRPWYIAGGWAIDIFLGRETREHDDIDVSVLRNDQAKLRTHLAAWAFEQVVDGRAASVARRGMAQSPGSRGPRDFGDPRPR